MVKELMVLGIALIMVFTFAACDNGLTGYKDSAKTELQDFAGGLDEEDYSEENLEIICGLVTAGMTAIDTATDETSVDSALSLAKQEIEGVMTIEETELAEYKIAKKAELQDFAGGLDEDDYSEANWEIICGLVTAGMTAIDEATDEASLDSALALAKQEIDEVMTITETELAEYKSAKKAELQDFADGLDEGDYSEENWEIICGLLTAAMSAIDEAPDETSADSALALAKQEIDEIEKKGEVMELKQGFYITDDKLEIVELYGDNLFRFVILHFSFVPSGSYAIKGGGRLILSYSNNSEFIFDIGVDQIIFVGAYVDGVLIKPGFSNPGTVFNFSENSTQ